jgi:hypothetical protein
MYDDASDMGDASDMDERDALGMDDGKLASVVAAEIEDAVSFIDTDIGPDRAKAVDRYFGRPYGDEEEGRSTVISRDVHDTINAILPSLMRVFFGSENVVEFAPESEEDVQSAEQATDYINYVVTVDNDGFEVFLAAIKNALREKVGFIKWWWDDSVTVTTTKYTGLDEMALTQILEDLQKSVDAEIVETSEGEDGLNVTLRLKKRVDRVRIAAIPPDEFLIGRRMRTLDDEGYVGHRTEKRVSELVAMGYDRDEVLAASSDGSELDTSDERQARMPYQDTMSGVSSDDSSRLVLYVESYINVDYDGDGIAELRRICTLGPAYKVVANEPVDERPFADLQCDPEPHAFFGESVADKVVDIQKVKTRVLRASLDSLSQSVFPRTVVGRGGNMEDAMNTEVGAILRAEGDASSAYYFAAAPFVGREAFPMLSYMDELREGRTGMSKVSMGLDAEALQNTTATAANGQFTRSQERIELIARVMASGVRRLFRGLLKLTVENQRAQRMVKLRNQWVPVDPRAWRVNMDVVPNVALGGGTAAEKMSLLSMIAAKQEQIFTTAGLNNPLVTMKQYHTTLSKMLETGGFKDPNAFFTDPEGEQAQARMAQMQGQEPPPDPKVEEAKARIELEAAKMQAQAQRDEQKAAGDLQLAREKHALEMQQRREERAADLAFKRELAEAELTLKREEMQMEYALKSEANRMNGSQSYSINGPEQGGIAG